LPCGRCRLGLGCRVRGSLIGGIAEAADRILVAGVVVVLLLRPALGGWKRIGLLAIEAIEVRVLGRLLGSEVKVSCIKLLG
jgi:hypothetical protein